MKQLVSTTVYLLAGWLAFPSTGAAGPHAIRLKLLGTHETGLFDEAGGEFVAHDPLTQRLYTVSANAVAVNVLSILNPKKPALIATLDLSGVGGATTCVAVRDGVLAVAVQAEVKTDPGRVVFFDRNLRMINKVTVGALPDMLAFSPNGRWLLTANEGEPSNDYTIDPEGSVSVIDMAKGPANLTQADVRTAGFASFNGTTLDPSIRIYGPKIEFRVPVPDPMDPMPPADPEPVPMVVGSATVAQDLEPEYLAISDDSTTAWVSLQENNALAEVDIASARVIRLMGLGFKDHMRPGHGLDPSDRDQGIHIANYPVWGMYQPDAIAFMRLGNAPLIVTVNEGDARAYETFSEEARVGGVVLDETAFPEAEALQDNALLGRLRTTSATGDFDHDGDHDAIFSFGARSFSIWSVTEARMTDGLLFDSGDEFERLAAAWDPRFFNAGNDNNDFDNRSDDKGPEPEGLAVADLYGNTYAFIAWERFGGVVAYDISNPFFPELVDYVNNRNFRKDVATSKAGDLGPEGVIVVRPEHSPTGQALVVVANEVSGSTSIYAVQLTRSQKSAVNSKSSKNR